MLEFEVHRADSLKREMKVKGKKESADTQYEQEPNENRLKPASALIVFDFHNVGVLWKLAPLDLKLQKHLAQKMENLKEVTGKLEQL